VGLDNQENLKILIQVGKSNKNGQPVKRERDAIDDIQKALNQDVTFINYNQDDREAD